MKLLRLLPLLLLLSAAPPVVIDSSLDGLWFKVTIKCKGRAVKVDGSKELKSSATVPAYLRFTLALLSNTSDGEAPSVGYVYDAFTESSPGTWTDESSDEILVVLTPVDDYIAPNVFITAVNPDTSLQVQTTLLIHVKRDKQGVVKSAKLTTLGGNQSGGANPDGFLFGDAKITGKTIDPADLPFVP